MWEINDLCRTSVDCWEYDYSCYDHQSFSLRAFFKLSRRQPKTKAGGQAGDNGDFEAVDTFCSDRWAGGKAGGKAGGHDDFKAWDTRQGWGPKLVATIISRPEIHGKARGLDFYRYLLVSSQNKDFFDKLISLWNLGCPYRTKLTLDLRACCKAHIGPK